MLKFIKARSWSNVLYRQGSGLPLPIQLRLIIFTAPPEISQHSRRNFTGLISARSISPCNICPHRGVGQKPRPVCIEQELRKEPQGCCDELTNGGPENWKWNQKGEIECCLVEAATRRGMI